MIILDTNVVSELFRSGPSPAVVKWFEAAVPARLFVTALTKAEMLVGLTLMPDGRRKRILESIIHTFFNDRLVTPVLPFGDKEAEPFAQIVAQRREIDRPIGPFDAQIAAIARSHRFAVATRNTDDFMYCGVHLINPWETEA